MSDTPAQPPTAAGAEMKSANKFKMPWKVQEVLGVYKIVDCNGKLLISTSYKDLAEHIVALAEYHQEHKGWNK